MDLYVICSSICTLNMLLLDYSCSQFFDVFLFPSAVSAGVFERDSVELGNSTPGLRSMAISSDGQYLAAGDCQGNLHIYNIHTSEYICFQVNVGTYLKCQNICLVKH